jgi:hypothetical protein
VPVQYKYVFDSAYCKTVISRFYRQRPFYLRLHFQLPALLKLRKSREFGKEVTIALSEAGLEASGSNGHSVVKWNAYPRSVRYSDGILLARGGSIRWLPDSALEEGSIEEAIALVRAKTSFRSIGA